MNIIAIDLGKFNSMVCFYDSNTQKHRFMNAKTEQGYFRSLLTNHTVDLVVVEACGPSGWVNDLCQELEIPIIVNRINCCKNTIRASFANRGVQISDGAKTWHKPETSGRSSSCL